MGDLVCPWRQFVCVCACLHGGQIKVDSCQIILPLNMPLPLIIWSAPCPIHTPVSCPSSEELAAGWPWLYVLLSVRCCAPASMATAPNHECLWLLVQSLWLPAVSDISRERDSGCLRLCLTATLEERIRETQRGKRRGNIPLRWAIFPYAKPAHQPCAAAHLAAR